MVVTAIHMSLLLGVSLLLGSNHPEERPLSLIHLCISRVHLVPRAQSTVHLSPSAPPLPWSKAWSTLIHIHNLLANLPKATLVSKPNYMNFYTLSPVNPPPVVPISFTTPLIFNVAPRALSPACLSFLLVHHPLCLLAHPELLHRCPLCVLSPFRLASITGFPDDSSSIPLLSKPFLTPKLESAFLTAGSPKP